MEELLASVDSEEIWEATIGRHKQCELSKVMNELTTWGNEFVVSADVPCVHVCLQASSGPRPVVDLEGAPVTENVTIVQTISTHPAHRRKGHASATLAEIERISSEMNKGVMVECVYETPWLSQTTPIQNLLFKRGYVRSPYSNNYTKSYKAITKEMKADY